MSSSWVAVGLAGASATLLLAGCKGPASAPAPRPPSSRSASALPAVTAEPTVLSAEQKARDRLLVPKAEAILAAYANVSPSLSPDGQRLLFRSNRGGVWEAYVSDVASPSAPARRVLSGPEAVHTVQWSRDGKWLLFARDQNGDENHHYFRAAVDGSGIIDLTPGAKTRRENLFLPHHKPDRMVYSTRAPESPVTQVVVQSIAGGAPKVVHSDSGPGYLLGGNAAGTHSLLLRFVSLGDQILFDVDLESGKARRFYPTEGTSSGVSDAAFSADGRQVFVATDEGKEGASVLALDARTAVERARYQLTESPGAMISALAVSPRGDRIAIEIEAGSVRTGKLLDARTLRAAAPLALPPGILDLGTFSDDGKLLTVVQAVADRPRDPYLIEVATGTMRPLRDDPREGIGALPRIAASVERVTAFDGLSIPVNVYLPAAKPGSKLPTIVEFHGGPEGSSHLFWKTFNRFFTAEGFAYVEPNIRGSTGFGRAYEQADNLGLRPDSFRDIESVNRWVKAQPWCDPDRVVILGESYGGYLVLSALTRQPTLWAAGIDLYGPSSLPTFLRTGNASARTIYANEIGDLQRDAGLLESLSPLGNVAQIKAPLFVYQASGDPRTPRSESDQLVRALREQKQSVEYMLVDDEGHSLDRHANKVEFLTRTARFLRDALKLRAPGAAH